MDILELGVWLLLLLGTIVAWCVVAVLGFFVGWGLAAEWPKHGDVRERLLFYALLITLVVLVIPASVFAGNIISVFI
jgi:hypothetical protein